MSVDPGGPPALAAGAARAVEPDGDSAPLDAPAGVPVLRAAPAASRTVPVPLVDLPVADQRAAARDMARAEPGLTGAQLAGRFGRRERWGREQIAAARGEGVPPRRRRGTAGTTAPVVRHAGNGAAPAAGGSPGGAPRAGGRATRPRAGRADRWVVRLTGAAVVVVMLSPMVLSAQSLAGWARDALGLVDPWTYVVPVTLDFAALVCVGLTFHAMLRGDSAGAARLLVWVFAGASSLANWRHGIEISPDAAVYYPAMPLVTALLLDITLRRVRRSALAGLGALERPLPRYRAARWIVAPAETWRAWRTAVRENITNPDEALTAARRHRTANRAARAARAAAPPQAGPREVPGR